MDRLWFHQIILFSESTTLLVPKTLKQQPQHITESLIASAPDLSLATPPDKEISSAASPDLQEDETPSPESPKITILVIKTSSLTMHIVCFYFCFTNAFLFVTVKG